MRGKKARALRREALPPELREELKDRVHVIAVTRAEAIGKARNRREEKIRAAQAECRKTFDEAWATFETARAAIVTEIEQRATAPATAEQKAA